MKKRHDQYCPIARTLDVLGDRWSLLILRELLLGDRRFVDLREWLPGVSPTLLTKRLQQLTANGLVTTIELPPPAARTVYTATAKGREAIPILRAMIHFGMKLLPPPRQRRSFAPSPSPTSPSKPGMTRRRQTASMRSIAWLSTVLSSRSAAPVA